MKRATNQPSQKSLNQLFLNSSAPKLALQRLEAEIVLERMTSAETERYAEAYDQLAEAENNFDKKEHKYLWKDPAFVEARSRFWAVAADMLELRRTSGTPITAERVQLYDLVSLLMLLGKLNEADPNF